MTATAPRYRPAADNAITVLLAAEGSTMTRRTLLGTTPGRDAEVTAPADPLKGIRAVTGLTRELRDRLRDYVRYAREDGATWERTGQAMDLHPNPDRGITIAGAAFSSVAYDLGRGLVFAWTCPQCRGAILDAGPDAGTPEDAEPGHAGNCPRLVAALEAWEAQWEDAGDE